MAATITPTPPAWPAEHHPALSKLNNLLDLAKVVPAIRKNAIETAHELITSATSMADLGYYTKIPGVSLRADMLSNYELTVKVFKCDEGLYAHLLNKVAKLIREGAIPNEDHLFIMDWSRGWVRGDLYPTFGDSGVCLLERPAIAAVVNYTNLMMGHTD